MGRGAAWRPRELVAICDQGDSVARYARRYGRQDRIFRMAAHVLQAVMRPKPGRSLSDIHPRRVLLVNAGHLGDAVFTTGLIPVLKQAFPGGEVGFLTGSYSRLVVDPHPLIDRVHFIDHWHTSRDAVPRWRKMARYVAAMPGLVRELRAAQYDVAIDVRCWFPNLVSLIWMAGIPVRIGYDRLGGGPLLTHPVPYVNRIAHEFDYQVDLLAGLPIPQASLRQAWPVLASPSSAALAEARAIVGEGARYCVLHPVASTPTKDWKAEHWCELARALLARGITPVVTGTEPKAKALASLITAAAPSTIDAVNALSWMGLTALIAHAEAVYSVDTVIGHLGSALRRPVVSISGGMVDPTRWAPLGATVATRQLPCNPCLVKAGCGSRACILDVSVSDVLSARARLAVATSDDRALELHDAEAP